MDADFFGCQSLADLARLVDLQWVKNEKEAATAYGRAHCTILHKGDQLKVQDVSSIYGAVCLREPHFLRCYWTSAQMLKHP